MLCVVVRHVELPTGRVNGALSSPRSCCQCNPHSVYMVVCVRRPVAVAVLSGVYSRACVAVVVLVVVVLTDQDPFSSRPNVDIP